MIERGRRVEAGRFCWGWGVAGRAVLAIVVVTAFVLAGIADAGSDGKAAETAPAATEANPLAYFKLDRPKRQIVIGAVVSVREGGLEFAVSGPAKSHEALLVTLVPPSGVHAGLLALGLRPGKPARMAQPAGAEPVFMPPEGALLEITVRWKDAAGAREAPLTDWMVVAGTGKPAPPTRWVFVGSEFLDDGRYWADMEGQLVSVANFAASTIDVPFKSTDKDALLEFAANPKVVPPAGTRVQVVITAVKGAETAPVARISFQVDSLGRATLDGQAIAPEKIASTVKQFLARHSRGAADIRMDPRAMIYDREVLEGILTEAGLTDLTFKMRYPQTEILPRTSAETAQAMSWWAKEFGRASDRIIDPAEDAAAALRHLEDRRKQLEELSELWGDYAAGLRELVKKYREKHPAKDEDSP